MKVASAKSVSAPPRADLRSSEFVARLQESTLFQGYKEAFQTATGLPLVLRPAGYYKAAMGDARRINPFCVLMASSSKVCASCLELQARMERQPGGGALTFECFAGISLSAVPVRLGESAVAWLQTGQILLHEPTRESFQALLRQLREANADVEVRRIEAAYFGTRVMPKAQYEAILHLLESFSSHLSMISNDLLLKQAASEVPAVSKARAFIAEHLGESIALSDVARAANMSSFHFCKVFKAALGVTFTDYLSRARVEKTKQLLLDPHKRVSEAAFEVGFQSLSQFNRAFRRITGESPSSYREHLQRVARKMGARRAFDHAA